MTVTKIFSHRGDLDGWASAAIALPTAGRAKPELHLVEYGEPFPAEIIQEHDKVIILDFCPEDPDMVQEIIEKSSVFWWIDHHVSSRRMVEEHNFLDLLSPPSAFITDSEENPMAACELAYMFFKKVEYKDIPYHIRLLGRYDIWDHTDKQTLPFQYAMRAYLDPPTQDMQKWKKLINPSKTDLELFKRLIDAGTYIKMYEDKKNASIAKHLCFEMEFEGYRTIAVNRILESSLFFKEVYNPKKHDLMLQFGWDGNQWKLSFRSDKKTVDCSKLAEKYSGGGHAGAAGAAVQELPPDIRGALYASNASE